MACVIDKSSRSAKLKRAFEELPLLRLIDVGFGRFDRNAGRVDREANGGARHQQVVGIAVHAAHVIAGGIEPADRRFVLRHDFKAFIEMPQGNI